MKWSIGMRKYFSLKESRLFLAAAFAVQSVTFFSLSLALCTKKKGAAAALLAASAVEGGAAAYLMHQMRCEMREGLDAAREGLENGEFEIEDRNLKFDERDEGVAEPATVIPTEETVSEEEFQ